MAYGGRYDGKDGYRVVRSMYYSVRSKVLRVHDWGRDREAGFGLCAGVG